MGQLVKEGELLWQPSDDFQKQSNMVDYMKWLQSNKNLHFKNYEEMWKWSVTEIESFWESLWDYFLIKSTADYLQVLSERKMPGAKWFTGAKLNYAEHIFRNVNENDIAILAKSELRPLEKMTWSTLNKNVAAFAAGLKKVELKKETVLLLIFPTFQKQ